MAKILVVDDKMAACESIRSALEEFGHTVHTAQYVDDGVEALKRSAARGLAIEDRYAVAIIDLRFENFEGTEAEKETAGMQVVEAARKVPFLESIVLTAYPSEQTAAQALAQGIFRYVMKSEEERGRTSESERHQLYMGRLVEAVELAIENRELMRTLAECLRELDELLEVLVSTGQQQKFVSDASFYLDTARKAYRTILEARGRDPRGTGT